MSGIGKHKLSDALKRAAAPRSRPAKGERGGTAANDQDWESDLGQFEREGLANASEHIRLAPGVLAPGWRLIKALMLRIERDEDGRFVVSDEVFAIHGDGETRDAAIRDYVQTLIEYFDLLIARTAGDEPTTALFRHLNRYLEKEGGQEFPAYLHAE